MPTFPAGFVPIGYFKTRTAASITANGEWFPLTYTEEMRYNQLALVENASTLVALSETNLTASSGNFTVRMFYDRLDFDKNSQFLKLAEDSDEHLLDVDDNRLILWEKENGDYIINE